MTAYFISSSTFVSTCNILINVPFRFRGIKLKKTLI